VRVATFNIHAGVDGWGRPTSALEHAFTLGADVLICPETWRGEQGSDLYQELSDGLGMQGTFVSLATGKRLTTGRGGKSWQPRLAHFTGERGLYFSEHRDLTKSQRASNSTLDDSQSGSWGLALLTSLSIEEIRVEQLGRLRRERVSRALIVARLNDGQHSFYVLAVHGAHITHGSQGLYRRINEIAGNLDPPLPIIFGGDFNCWRPLLRVFLPGWHSLVRARTWPARRPHSQIDHLLGRGPWKVDGGGASDGGSDHRALVADVHLAT
jgi:endonuclease/exonuclease/phosphatase family metal-dependent hydrolase